MLFSRSLNDSTFLLGSVVSVGGPKISGAIAQAPARPGPSLNGGFPLSYAFEEIILCLKAGHLLLHLSKREILQTSDVNKR